MSFLSPYRAVLRTPYARAAFAASLVGRLCYGIVSLSLILTLTAGGRNYRFAGLVMALFGVAVVLASPARAGLVDRYGPRRALPLMAAAFAAVLGQQRLQRRQLGGFCAVRTAGRPDPADGLPAGPGAADVAGGAAAAAAAGHRGSRAAGR